MKKCEYINEFFYFVVRPDENKEHVLVCCMGVNIDRFLPLTKGKHGLASNPVIRGLQLVKHGISTLALSKGAIPKLVRGTACAGIAPTPETWFTELSVIEKAQELSPDEIVAQCVRSFLEKVATGCGLEDLMNYEPKKPKQLQKFLELLCKEQAKSSVVRP